MTFLERLIRKELERYPEEHREPIYQEMFGRDVLNQEVSYPQEERELYTVDHIPDVVQWVHGRASVWYANKPFRDAREAARQQFLALSIPEQLWEVLQAIKGNRNQ